MMKGKGLILILAILAFGCQQQSKIVYEKLDDTKPDKVSLYKINGSALMPIGEFSFNTFSSYELSTARLDVGLYKIVKHYGTTRKSINFISDGDIDALSIIDDVDSLFAYGSYETERLFKILNHTKGCDQEYFELQKKIVANTFNPEQLQILKEQEATIATNCLEDLIKFIRMDASSIASLYSTDFLDPAEHSDLIDSIFVETKNKYGDLYLHHEIRQRLSLNSESN